MDFIKVTSKQCPKCGFGVTHFHGHACHHIKPVTGCPNCGHNWCYRCRKPGKSGNHCGCRLFCQNDGLDRNAVWLPFPWEAAWDERFVVALSTIPLEFTIHSSTPAEEA